METEIKEMTWAEFKQYVEAQGVEDRDKIAWIDWSGPAPAVDVKRDHEGRIKITHCFAEKADG